MKAESLLTRVLARRAGLTKTMATKVARHLAHQQVVRSICEDGRPVYRREDRHGGTDPRPN